MELDVETQLLEKTVVIGHDLLSASAGSLHRLRG